MKTQYMTTFENTKESEGVLRKFLFDNSDKVRFTNTPIAFEAEKKGNKFMIMSDGVAEAESGQEFQKTLEELKPDFIKQVINNKKYNDIEQSRNSRFTHYFYKLSNKIKEMITEETLFFHYPVNQSKFHGFEDPTFYKGEEMIASVISHEPLVFLYLTTKEKEYLEFKGVELQIVPQQL